MITSQSKHSTGTYIKFIHVFSQTREWKVQMSFTGSSSCSWCTKLYQLVLSVDTGMQYYLGKGITTFLKQMYFLFKNFEQIYQKSKYNHKAKLHAHLQCIKNSWFSWNSWLHQRGSYCKMAAPSMKSTPFFSFEWYKYKLGAGNKAISVWESNNNEWYWLFLFLLSILRFFPWTN